MLANMLTMEPKKSKKPLIKLVKKLVPMIPKLNKKRNGLIIPKNTKNIPSIKPSLYMVNLYSQNLKIYSEVLNRNLIKIKISMLTWILLNIKCNRVLLLRNTEN